MSDKHRTRYVALEVKYVILLWDVKNNLPICHLQSHLPRQMLARWSCQQAGVGRRGCWQH
jgi:hypothetical protein